jgi:hypothetical protein
MTQEKEKPIVTPRLVVVFDICSSTTILEDLKRTDHSSKWRDLLIDMKNYLLDEISQLGPDAELYKFVGDGWIILLPIAMPKEELCSFLTRLSFHFDSEFKARIWQLLSHAPDPMGLMFGIDSGELMQFEMNNQKEYIGRAINVAARLQSETKNLSAGPSYQALISKNAFYSPPPTKRIPVENEKANLRNISGGKDYECRRFTTLEPKANLFDFLEDKLCEASYFGLPNPVDVLRSPEVLDLTVVDEPVLLVRPDPPTVSAIMDDVIERVRKEVAHANPNKLDYAFYRDLLAKEKKIAEGQDTPPSTTPERLGAYRSIRETQLFEDERRRAIQNFFTYYAISPEAGKGFENNGTLLAVSDMKYLSRNERDTIQVVLQPTDYFTYRVIAGCANEIRGFLLSNTKLTVPIGFKEYVDSGIQEFVHLSLGALIMIHTLVDDRVIIRRRSSTAADFGEAGKLYATVNEGFRAEYYEKQTKKLLPIKDMLTRMLRNEVFGPPAQGEIDLIRRTENMFLTGALVFLPNFSIDLCFLARTNCTVDQVRAAVRTAPHAPKEFKIWREYPTYKLPEVQVEEMKEYTVMCPKFGDLGDFVRNVTDSKPANEDWDEGSIIAVLLSTLVPAKASQTAKS